MRVDVFVSTASWTTCRLSFPGKQTLLLGPLDGSGPLSEGKDRLRNPFVEERTPLKRINNEDIQRAAPAHKDAHSLHSKKKKALPCLLRTPAARSLSNTNWLTYTLHSPLGTNSKHTSFIIVTLRSFPSHQASGRSFPRRRPLLWQSRSLLTRSHAQLNPTSPPGAFNDLR